MGGGEVGGVGGMWGGGAVDSPIYELVKFKTKKLNCHKVIILVDHNISTANSNVLIVS